MILDLEHNYVQSQFRGGGVNRRFFKITEEIDREDKKHDFNSSMYLLLLSVWKYAWYMRQNIMEIFNTKIMEKTYQFMRISHHRPYTVSSAGLPAWLQHGY